MHEDEVVLGPVVALVVVDSVTTTFDDVDGCPVLVTVSMVRGLRRKLDEMHLEWSG